MRQQRKVGMRTAAVIQFASKYTSLFAQLFITAILARMLSPADFGTLAIILVFLNFFIPFADMGIGAAIIQYQDLDDRDYGALFTFSIFFALFYGLLVFAAAFYCYARRAKRRRHYGTVGSGVFEVLNENKESISRRAGQELHVKYVLDLRDFPGQPVEKVLVHDYEQIVSDPEVDIVVEVMGGVEPAYTFVKKALLAGKNVCTSNKALVAKHGRELMDIAKEKSINFLFEASCGGGIPIIRVINSSLTGDEIDEVTGILNGTTNYMLYKMSTEGCEFDTVLKEAQQKGYAEADPTADVEGYDACRKIAILSSLAYERYFDFEDIYTEGITKITPEDMEYAAKLGRTIKLLGTSRRLADGTCYAMVAPFMLGQNSPLYSVNDVFNAVFVHGNMLGDAMFYGSGAGKLPTASAVVGDIVDAAKHLHVNIVTNWNSTPAVLKPLDEVTGKFFVRIKKEAAEEAKKVFGDVEIISLGQLPQECAFITDEMTQGAFEEKLAQIGDQVLAKIRVKD